MKIYNDILVNILALEKGFEDYEFIHAYLGPPELKNKASKIDCKTAYNYLLNIYNELDTSIENVFPYFRRTYIEDLLKSVLLQADFFIFNKQGGEFDEIVETLQAFELIPSFNIEKELDELNKFSNKSGLKSVKDLKNHRQKILFKNKKELENYIAQVIDEFAGITSQKYSDIFGFDIKKLFSKSKIEVTSTKKDDPPCYYFYKEENKGVLGIKLKNQFTKEYIKSFICHEIIPGHHLYYLIKQYYIDNHSLDVINTLDTFYSPENIINEGLAVNADLIFGDFLDIGVLATIKIEKFLHKLFYNIWYLVNIENKKIDKIYYDILKHEIGFPDELIEARIKYYTVDDKYYTPSYPIGTFFVEKAIEKIGTQNIPKLYFQNSLNTLIKMQKGLE